VVPGDRTRDNGYKLKHGMIHLNIRKHYLTVRVIEHWHSLPKEVVKSPSLEIFKSYLDVIPSNWLYVVLLGRGVEPDDPPRSRPTSAIL